MTRLEPHLRAFDYGRLIDGPGRELSRARPRDVHEILTSQLRQLAEEDEQGISFILRSAIEDTDQALSQASDHLIRGVRNSLLDLADSDEPDLPQILTGHLTASQPIFRRLALFLLTERPKYISTVSSSLVVPVSIYERDTYHEQMRLVQERFFELPSIARRRIHQAIAGGLKVIDVEPDEQSAEQLSASRRAWRLLNVLPDETLTKNERRRKDELIEQSGPLKHPLDMFWSSGMQAMRAPADAEQMTALLEEGGHEKLIEVLRSPREYFEFDWLHDEELVWEVVAELVPQDPNYHLTLADLLEPRDFPNAWRYLDAYGELAKKGVSFGWAPLLTNIKRLITSEGSQEAYWSVARILTAAVRGAHSASSDDMGILVDIASHILERTFTALENVASIERDLAMHQLNAPAGASADTLVGVVFREALDMSTPEEMSTSFPERVRMNQAARSILDRGVTEGWGGVELRFAIGQMLHRIIWADHDWLGGRLEGMLPLAPRSASDHGAWRAFWAGHLRTSSVFERIMVDLRERYAVLVADAAREEPAILGQHWQGHDRDTLGSYLKVAWLRGYDGFGRDGLLGQFVSGVSDETRAFLVQALPYELNEAKKSTDERWRTRIQTELEQFWRERTEALRSAVGEEEVSKESGAFALWLEEADQGVKEIEDRLTVMAGHMELDYQLEKLIDYLIRFAALEPEATSRVLRAIANRLVRSAEAVWHVQRLPEVLRAAWRSTSDDRSLRILRSVVSDLLEYRRIDLRGEIE